jgi:hypothetical protein
MNFVALHMIGCICSFTGVLRVYVCERPLTTLQTLLLPHPRPSRPEGCLAQPASCKPRKPQISRSPSSHRSGMARWCWLHCGKTRVKSPWVLFFIMRCGDCILVRYAGFLSLVTKTAGYVQSYRKVDIEEELWCWVRKYLVAKYCQLCMLHIILVQRNDLSFQKVSKASVLIQVCRTVYYIDCYIEQSW